ncbi:hypothetical protein GCM10009007_00430 [Formosimonas limnophila]|uniref:YgjP-like metallopeptidase domain-containing protein n=1 Tax=Formosimonas limnophila TaxID=1384487 RepID=A0A8J3FYX8_9BURK|nr:hypothetical protein GCM10009007_00430 [Formosimonas limnophila]
MKRLKQWLNTLQLSLFSDDDVVVTPPALSPSPQPHLSNDIDSIGGFKQPADSRPITLHTRTDSHTVFYRIERTRRRTVGMLIDENGLRVRAGARVPIAEIERILHSRADWIIKHLRGMKDKPRLTLVPSLMIENGDVLNILGVATQIFWQERVPKFNSTDAKNWLYQAGTTRQIILRKVTPERQEQTMVDALTLILLAYLHQRAEQYAMQWQLNYRSIGLSNAKTLWGTCKSDGSLRLNWRLVFLDASLVDYVLAHELAHTVEMNHSRAFWAVVEKLCPDYKKRRELIKAYDLRNS